MNEEKMDNDQLETTLTSAVIELFKRGYSDYKIENIVTEAMRGDGE